jgi:2-polyprenyl-6-methoxyphenol hydroxylase-like FAD-dependent oxidoreductase
MDVTLSDGTERTVDLVIGADGPHSATRRLAFGLEDTFVHPLGGYMAWFTAPESATLDGWYQPLLANPLAQPVRDHRSGASPFPAAPRPVGPCWGRTPGGCVADDYVSAFPSAPSRPPASYPACPPSA